MIHYIYVRAKVFKNGRSQAVRIPKEFRLNATEVFIRKDTNGDLVLSTKDTEFDWPEFLKQVRDLPLDERKKFIVNRNLIEAKPKDFF